MFYPYKASLIAALVIKMAEPIKINVTSFRKLGQAEDSAQNNERWRKMLLFRLFIVISFMFFFLIA